MERRFLKLYKATSFSYFVNFYLSIGNKKVASSSMMNHCFERKFLKEIKRKCRLITDCFHHMEKLSFFGFDNVIVIIIFPPNKYNV